MAQCLHPSVRPSSWRWRRHFDRNTAAVHVIIRLNTQQSVSRFANAADVRFGPIDHSATVYDDDDDDGSDDGLALNRDRS